ncbi:MAG: hypothetical protein K0S32_2894, partial [Bacteroidetes bacterium]|nr:hypothetical protein [Bacteroidota bacterium]
HLLLIPKELTTQNHIRFVLSIILMLCISIPVFSQEKKEGEKKKKEKKKQQTQKYDDDDFDMKNYKLEPSDRLILELNHTTWTGLKAPIKSVLPSVGMNIAVMFDKPIGYSNFTFGYGIGFFSHNFHSNADFVYMRDSLTNSFTTKLEPFNRPFSLNRYAEKILEIPIEIRFKTKTDRQFKIHVGGKIGYVVNNFRSIRDNDGKVRVYDIKNINPFRYGVNCRIAFQQFAITASYYFSEVFVKDKGPANYYPYAFGIAIMPY